MRDRRIALTVVLASLVALTLSYRDAQGQLLGTSVTGTPTPLPTATATPPSGDQILARMQRAIRTAGSARYVTKELSITKQERVTTTTHADISWGDNLLREHDLTSTVMLNRHPAISTIFRRTLLFAHAMAASRSSLNHSWYCEPLHGVHVADSFLPFQVGTPAATDLGLIALGGDAVWHVQARAVPVYTWALRAATVDFYVGQADNTLRVLDIHGTTKLAGKTSQESIEERYSRYGKRMSVTLPATCR